MRIKARALGIAAEDYFNDKVLEDTDLLYRGMRELPADFWDRHGKGMESWQQGGHTYYRLTGPLVPSLHQSTSSCYQEKQGEAPFYAIVKEIQGKTALLSTLKDYTHQKNNVWGITARNREQNFALNLLMNPGDRLRHAARPGRHGQDAADARRGPDADARVQGLLRDHHDARHRAGRRGHRLPARHRGGEDESRGWARSRTTSTC